MTAADQKRLAANLSTGQLAELFGYTGLTWRRLMESGHVPGFRLPGATVWRMSIEDALDLATRFNCRHARTSLERMAAERGIAVRSVPSVLLVQGQGQAAALLTALAEAGFDATAASNVFRAGQVLSSRGFRAVLVDQEIGSHHAQQIAAAVLSSTPAVVLGVLLNEDEPYAQAVAAAGYRVCWRKPIDPERVAADLWQLLMAEAAVAPDNLHLGNGATKKRRRSRGHA